MTDLFLISYLNRSEGAVSSLQLIPLLVKGGHLQRPHKAALGCTFFPSALPLASSTHTGKRKGLSEMWRRQREMREIHTRCCISALSCCLTGRCVCGGNRDSRFSLDSVLGEGRVLGDTRSRRRTPLGTAPWLTLAPPCSVRCRWEGRRKHSQKTPDPWDTHGLRVQLKRETVQWWVLYFWSLF